MKVIGYFGVNPAYVVCKECRAINEFSVDDVNLTPISSIPTIRNDAVITCGTCGREIYLGVCHRDRDIVETFQRHGHYAIL